MFRRKLLILGLALGTIGGYAAGFRSMRHCNYQRDGRWDARAERYERYERSERSNYTDGFAAGARACAEASHEGK
jgi:hypothetical protein